MIHLAGASLDEANVVCDRLRQTTSALRFHSPNGSAFSVTISFGISTAQKGMPIGGVVTRSDLALYAAKKGGRNRVYYWKSGEVTPYTPEP